jgi:glutaredoxin-like protein
MEQERTTIMVYGTTWCPDCVRAKRVLDQHQVRYEWIDIAQHTNAAAYVERANGGMRRVPTIVFPDGSILVEPSNAELARRLNDHIVG